MSEGQTLFLVIVFLYLSDCIVWISKSTIVFSSTWCSQWRIAVAGDSFGNADGSLTFLNPLLPSGINFFVHWMTVSLSPEGICDYGVHTVPGVLRPIQTGKHWLFDKIQEVHADGKCVFVNQSRFTRCGSPKSATVLVQLIKRLIAEPVEERTNRIREYLEGQFAIKEARYRLDEVHHQIRKIRWCCSAFFLVLYIIIPTLTLIYGLVELLIPAAVLMLTSGVCIAVYFTRAHSHLFPSQTFDRVSNLIKMILCPPTALRAVDLITRDVLISYHPLLVAHLLYGKATREFTRSIICDLMHPIKSNVTDQQALQIIAWHINCELSVCSDFLHAVSATMLTDLLLPPPWDGESSAYCPHCLCQFGAPLAECPDCPGVKLEPFSTTEHTLQE